MRTMYPPGYHRNGFVATHRHMMYGYELPQSLSGNNLEGTLFS